MRVDVEVTPSPASLTLLEVDAPVERGVHKHVGPRGLVRHVGLHPQLATHVHDLCRGDPATGLRGRLHPPRRLHAPPAPLRKLSCVAHGGGQAVPGGGLHPLSHLCRHLQLRSLPWRGAVAVSPYEGEFHLLEGVRASCTGGAQARRQQRACHHRAHARVAPAPQPHGGSNFCFEGNIFKGKMKGLIALVVIAWCSVAAARDIPDSSNEIAALIGQDGVAQLLLEFNEQRDPSLQLPAPTRRLLQWPDWLTGWVRTYGACRTHAAYMIAHACS